MTLEAMARHCVTALAPLGGLIDLDLSMYPSFLSAFFRRVREGVWTKTVGSCRGLTVYVHAGSVCCEGPCCTEWHLNYLSGRWCLEECRKGIGRVILRLGERILEAYRGLTIVASRMFRLEVGLAVVLSQNTSYARNTIRWVETVLQGIENLGDEESLRMVAEALSRLPSPQPRRAAEILPHLAEALSRDSDDPVRLRARLLEIPGLGQKTVDSILLFAGYTTRVAPYDTHLAKFVRLLGVNGKKPYKAVCRREGHCAACKQRKHCLPGIIVDTFGGAAGLMQTIAFVHGSLGGEYDRSKLERLLKHFEAPGSSLNPSTTHSAIDA